MALESSNIHQIESGAWTVALEDGGRSSIWHHGVEVENVSSWELTPEVEIHQVAGWDGHYHSFAGRTQLRMRLEIILNPYDSISVPKLKEEIRDDVYGQMVKIIGDLQKKLAKSEKDKETAIDTILERLGKARGKLKTDRYGDTTTLFPSWAKRVFKGFRDNIRTFRVRGGA